MSANLIDSTEELSAYLSKQSGNHEPSVCAIDTEADSLHRYRESLCLIQFASELECVLIDPLAIEDLSPLGSYLARSARKGL
jgi:ribonuclease D